MEELLKSSQKGKHRAKRRAARYTTSVRVSDVFASMRAQVLKRNVRSAVSLTPSESQPSFWFADLIGSIVSGFAMFLAVLSIVLAQVFPSAAPSPDPASRHPGQGRCRPHALLCYPTMKTSTPSQTRACGRNLLASDATAWQAAC